MTAEDIRIWSWSALACGAKGIHYYAFYPISTGYESGGFGLIHLDGTVTERAREAGASPRRWRATSACIWRPGRRGRKWPSSTIRWRTSSVDASGRRPTAGRRAKWQASNGTPLLGVFKAFWPENVPVDFVHAGALSAGALSQYRLVYLPYPPMLPSYLGGVLRDYVRAGGHLVAEARAGWNSESGRASDIIPGMGLHEVFGAREAAVETAPGGRTVIVFEGGLRVPARWFREVLEPLGGRVVGRFEDGAPAAVESQFGRGRALLVGSYPAAAYHSTPTEEARRWFGSLLDWAGVQPELEVEGGVEARWLESGADRLVFVFNHEREPRQVRLKWRGRALGRIEDLMEGGPAQAEFTLPARRVRALRFAAP